MVRVAARNFGVKITAMMVGIDHPADIMTTITANAIKATAASRGTIGDNITDSRLPAQALG